MCLLIARDTVQGFQSTVSPLFLLRVSSLALDEIDRLRFEEGTTWRDTTLALEEQLAEGKDSVVSILYEAIGLYTENQALRRELLGLKREIFRQRLSRGTEKARHLLAALPIEKGLACSQWLDLYESYQKALASGPQIFAHELACKRDLFKRVIDTPDLRKGILLSSSLLDQAIDGFLASSNLSPDREARTVARSLSEYLLRACCKTSPFSTFTSVSPGMFEEEGNPATQFQEGTGIRCTIKSADKRSFTRLNIGMLPRFSSFLLSIDEIRRAMQVRVTHGWRMRGDRVQYVRRRQSSVDTETVAMDFDSVHESVFSLPAGRLLREVLNLLESREPMRFSEIVLSLCAREQYHGAEQEIEDYLSHLLRLGFLIAPALQLDIHSTNPLADYRKGLIAVSSPLTTVLAEHLETIEAQVDAYQTAAVSERRSLLSSVREQLQHCYHVLGQAQPTLPRTILYEDATCVPQNLAIHIQAKPWSDMLSHLAEFQRLLPVFQNNLLLKFIMRSYFRSRYGQGGCCDDLLSFVDAFIRDYFGRHQKDATQGSNPDSSGRFHRSDLSGLPDLSELRQLDTGRQEVANYLSAAWATLPSEDRELVLAEDFLKRVSSYIPQTSEKTQSHAFFSQLAHISDEPLLVINQVFSGFTSMFSRFAHGFSAPESSRVIATLRTTLAALQPEGAVFAELKGGYDATNLNLHPAITPCELLCPGEFSRRPQEEQIPLADLLLREDERESCLRLYSKRLGKEVIPLYLGFLTSRALPQIQQILLHCSYQSSPSLNLWEGVTSPQPSGPEIVVRYPRLRYKNLVLQRAMWKMPVNLVPRRASGQSYADFFLSLSRWRRAYGLPERAFFTALPDDPAKRGHLSHKPVYLDFENFFSLSLLEAITRQQIGRLVIQEMLPGREHLWLEQERHTYVSEFVIEMNRTRSLS